jgi:radical SAM superfamily enzyme YgiQ (UPF0313 family)
MSLSSYLKERGHEVEVFCSPNLRRVLNKVREYKPRVVGFHTITGQHLFAVKAAGRIKQEFKDISTIAGGPHATFFPELLRKGTLDYVGINECEKPLSQLLERLESGGRTDDISGIYAFRDGDIVENPPKNFVIDLDKLPFCDRDLYLHYTGSISNQFFISRGCPFDCSFCFNHKSKQQFGGQKYLRYRSPENVIEEIKNVLHREKLSMIKFGDDTFAFNRNYLKIFLPMYKKEIALPYMATFRAELMDKEMAHLFKDTGCIMTGMGVECGSERLRTTLLNKTVTNEQLLNAAGCLHGVKIPFTTCNMLALPGETIEQGFETIRMNIAMKTPVPWFSVFQPYPSTSLGEIAVKKYGMPPIDVDNYQSDYHTNSRFPGRDARELSNLHKFALFCIKFPWTIPAVRLLIKLPPNFFFTLIHRLGHVYTFYLLNERKLFKTIRMGVMHELAKAYRSI